MSCLKRRGGRGSEIEEEERVSDGSAEGAVRAAWRLFDIQIRLPTHGIMTHLDDRIVGLTGPPCHFQQQCGDLGVLLLALTPSAKIYINLCLKMKADCGLRQ